MINTDRLYLPYRVGGDQPELIKEFDGRYRFLSNFWPCYVEGPGGLVYGTVENAYQASKWNDKAVWACLSYDVELKNNNLKASEAKAFAKDYSKAVPIRDGFHDEKEAIMLDLLMQKFGSRNQAILDDLLLTGEKHLMEGNYWKDKFWGVDLKTGRGLNRLGILLMTVRIAKRNGVAS